MPVPGELDTATASGILGEWIEAVLICLFLCVCVCVFVLFLFFFLCFFFKGGCLDLFVFCPMNVDASE